MAGYYPALMQDAVRLISRTAELAAEVMPGDIKTRHREADAAAGSLSRTSIHQREVGKISKSVARRPQRGPHSGNEESEHESCGGLACAVSQREDMAVCGKRHWMDSWQARPACASPQAPNFKEESLEVQTTRKERVEV